MRALHEDVDVAHVIGSEDDGRSGRTVVEPPPHVGGVVRWCQRIQNQPFATGLDDCTGHDWFPVLILMPSRVSDAPNPEARHHVADLDRERCLVVYRSPSSSHCTATNHAVAIAYTSGCRGC